MRGFDDPAVQAVARQIERYFAEHASAGDSLEGICTWWLQGAQRDIDRETVKRALDKLVAEGRVEEVSLADSTTIYRRR
jgi:Fe2+ or Zn2+ uptake regulation protein